MDETIVEEDECSILTSSNYSITPSFQKLMMMTMMFQSESYENESFCFLLLVNEAVIKM